MTVLSSTNSYLRNMFVLHPDASQNYLIMVDSEILCNTCLGTA